MRRARLHPYIAVPPAERRKLGLAMHFAVEALAAGDPPGQWRDLLAAVALCRVLMPADKFTDDARQAVEAAAAALEAAEAGTVSGADAARACGPLVAVFEQLLTMVPLARLLHAQQRVRAAWDAAEVATAD